MGEFWPKEKFEFFVGASADQSGDQTASRSASDDTGKKACVEERLDDAEVI